MHRLPDIFFKVWYLYLALFPPQTAPENVKFVNFSIQIFSCKLCSDRGILAVLLQSPYDLLSVQV